MLLLYLEAKLDDLLMEHLNTIESTRLTDNSGDQTINTIM